MFGEAFPVLCGVFSLLCFDELLGVPAVEVGEVVVVVEESSVLEAIGGEVLIVTPIFPLSLSTSAFRFVPVGVSRNG